METVAVETRGREDGVPAEKKREQTQGERKQLRDYAQTYYTHLYTPQHTSLFYVWWRNMRYYHASEVCEFRQKEAR